MCIMFKRDKSERIKAIGLVNFFSSFENCSVGTCEKDRDLGAKGNGEKMINAHECAIALM